MEKTLWLSPVGKAISIYQLNFCEYLAEGQLALSGGALRRPRECQSHWRSLCVHGGARKNSRWGCMSHQPFVIGMSLSSCYLRWESLKGSSPMSSLWKSKHRTWDGGANHWWNRTYAGCSMRGHLTTHQVQLPTRRYCASRSQFWE